jgi:DNA-binding NarL/FixJ family response regulator
VEINVFVADQERTFADVLASRLEAEDDMEVVGVQVKAPSPWLTTGKSADVIVLDGDMPGEATNRLCEELSERDERTRVVALSYSSEPERVVQALQAGAAAWVRKDESLDHLLRVIRGVAGGETWLPPREAGDIVMFLLAERDRHRKNERLLASLTPRERTVLACLAEGAGHRDVATQLHLSVTTVRTHLHNLMTKLGVHSAVEAVALAQGYLDWLRPDGGSP